MADNLNENDLDEIIQIIRDHKPAPFGTELIKKLQALRDTFDLYPDVWVSTVRWTEIGPYECRADVMHISNEEFDELLKDDDDTIQ